MHELLKLERMVVIKIPISSTLPIGKGGVKTAMHCTIHIFILSAALLFYAQDDESYAQHDENTRSLSRAMFLDRTVRQLHHSCFAFFVLLCDQRPHGG